MSNYTLLRDKGLLDTLKFKSFRKTTRFKRYSINYTKTVRKSYSSRKFLSTYYPLSVISLAWITLYLKLRSKVSNSQLIGLLSSTFKSFRSINALMKLRTSFSMFHDDRHSYIMMYNASLIDSSTIKIPQSSLSYYENSIKGFNHQSDLRINVKPGDSFVMTQNCVLTLRRIYITLLLQHIA